MSFQVRELMSSVVAESTCAVVSTAGHDEPCAPPCPPPSCQGQSGCPRPTYKPPKIAMERLSVLRDQMRQALHPA